MDYDKSLYVDKWAALTKFLEVSRNQALQTKVMLASFDREKSDKVDKEITCRKCGVSGHVAKNCGIKKPFTATVNSNQVSTDDKKKEFQRQKDACGKCPLCRKFHTYFKTKEKEHWPSDRLFKCDQFMSLSLNDKASTLERLSCCPRCTSWRHLKAACPANSKCSKLVNGVKLW